MNPKKDDTDQKDNSKSTKDDTDKKGAKKDETTTNKDEKKIIDDAKKIIANEKNEIAKEKQDSKSSSSYAMAFSVLAVFVLSAILYFVCQRGSASNEPLRLYKPLPRQEPV